MNSFFYKIFLIFLWSFAISIVLDFIARQIKFFIFRIYLYINKVAYKYKRKIRAKNKYYYKVKKIVYRFIHYISRIFFINKLYKSIILSVITNFNRLVFEFFTLAFLILASFIARHLKKPIDVGLGPEPLINNIYHKSALKKYGYSAETFVIQVYFITNNFDVRGDEIFQEIDIIGNLIMQFFNIDRFFILQIYIYLRSIFRYKIIYIYFNGGPLLAIPHFKKFEPILYKLAKVRIVVMPYGGDIHVLSRSSNLNFKHAMSMDYLEYSKNKRKIIENQIDLWTKYADYVISGCDWSRYMYAWDRLMLGHFSIDTELWKPSEDKKINTNDEITILHAPNHKTIKGTEHFIQAVGELKKEGLPIKLQVVQKVSNSQLKKMIEEADIIADQIVIGWYAMFALEGMALKKPVLCYIDEEFEQLYIFAGLIKKGELPLVKCNFFNLKDEIRKLVLNKKMRDDIGEKSREFVINHHSIMYIGSIFDSINRSLGVVPTSI